MVLSSKMAAALVEVARHGTHALTRHFRMFVSRGAGACPSVCYTARGVHTGGAGGAYAQIRTRGSGQGRGEARRARRLQGSNLNAPSPVLSHQLKQRLLNNTSVNVSTVSQPRLCHPAFLESELSRTSDARPGDVRPGLNAISFTGPERKSILGCGGLTGAGSLLCPIPHTIQTPVRLKSSGGYNNNKQNGGRQKHQHGNGKKRKQKQRTKTYTPTNKILNDFGTNFKPFSWENGLFSGRMIKNSNIVGQNDNKDFVENWSTGFPKDRSFFGDSNVTRGGFDFDNIGHQQRTIDTCENDDAKTNEKKVERTEFVMKNGPQEILGPMVKVNSDGQGLNKVATILDKKQNVPSSKKTNNGHSQGKTKKISSKQSHGQKDTSRNTNPAQKIDPVEELVMKVANTTYKHTEELFRRLQPYIGTTKQVKEVQKDEPITKKSKLNADALKLKPNMEKKSVAADPLIKFDPEDIASKTFESRLCGPKLTVSKNEITTRNRDDTTKQDQFPYGHPSFVQRHQNQTSQCTENNSAEAKMTRKRKLSTDDSHYQPDYIREQNKPNEKQFIQNRDTLGVNKNKYTDDILSEKWANKYSSQQQYAYLRALLEQRSLGANEPGVLDSNNEGFQKQFNVLESEKARKLRKKHEELLASKIHPVDAALERQGKSISSNYPWISADITERDRGLIQRFSDENLMRDTSPLSSRIEKLYNPDPRFYRCVDPVEWRNLKQIPHKGQHGNDIKTIRNNNVSTSEDLLEDHTFFKTTENENDANGNAVKQTKTSASKAANERKGSRMKDKMITHYRASTSGDITNSLPGMVSRINENCVLLTENQCQWPDCTTNNVCELNTEREMSKIGRESIKNDREMSEIQSIGNNENLYKFEEVNEVKFDWKNRKIQEKYPEGDKTSQKKSQGDPESSRKKDYPRYLVDQAPFPFMRPRDCDVKAKNRNDVMDDIRTFLKGGETKCPNRRTELEHRYTRLIQRRQGELVNLLGKLRDLRARSSRKSDNI